MARGEQCTLGCGDDAAHGGLEVLAAEDDGLHVQPQLLAAAIDLRIPPPERHQSSLRAQSLNVRAAVT